MTHPKTGHDHRTARPDGWPLPQDVTIEIKRSACYTDPLSSASCTKGTKSCVSNHTEDKDVWYAELSGYIMMDDGTLKVWCQMTHGDSPAHAASAAADLMRLSWDECKEPGLAHCYCRDVSYSWFDADEVMPCVECCLCAVKVSAKECEP